MSDRTFWIVIGGWSLCVVVMLVWMYRAIKKNDQAWGGKDIDWNKALELTAEELARTYPKPVLHKVTTLPSITAPTFPDKAWQERARKAEGLGFLDSSGLVS
jgi:hypothetical protein